jgi:hypothetical protein
MTGRSIIRFRMKKEAIIMNKALISALSLTVALAFAAPLVSVTAASAASTTAAASTTTTTAPAKPMVKKHKKAKKHAAAKKTDKDQKKS